MIKVNKKITIEVSDDKASVNQMEDNVYIVLDKKSEFPRTLNIKINEIDNLIKLLKSFEKTHGEVLEQIQKEKEEEEVVISDPVPEPEPEPDPVVEEPVEPDPQPEPEPIKEEPPVEEVPVKEVPAEEPAVEIKP
jgi:outer membrane biosynthesis protein TonB